MQCIQCQSENALNAKFCNQCGSPFASVCSACGRENAVDAKFCNQCGMSLTLSSSSVHSIDQGTDSERSTHKTSSSQAGLPPRDTQVPDAERRQLTVMFCDLADSTTLSTQLDPETLRDVIRAYQTSCDEIVQRFEGHIAQLLGDGLLVYFGYPKAHEEDAQRAVLAGLGIVEAIKALNPNLEREHGIQLAVRLGIHTGLVVVGEMGGASRQEQLALGETPNIAARLQGLAAPDTVVLSNATAQLVQGYFEVEPLGEQILREVAEPMAVHHVLCESGARSRFDIAPTLTPLVGREQELGLLMDRWEQAKSGQGQVVLLSGEAGIGKSRLVQVLKEHAATRSHTRLECRSSPYYQNTALYPMIDLLERDAGLHRDDLPQVKLEKLEHILLHYQHPLEETVPLYATLLSLPIPEHRYPALTLSPQQQRQKTLEILVAMLIKLAESQPVLLILEDLHWSDPSTLELLTLLIPQVPTTSLCLLLTGRPEFQSSWGSHSYVTHITLNPLPRDQVESMAEQVIGGKGLPSEVIEQIVERADGVPLFVEELTKSVVESGCLQEEEEHYFLPSPLPPLAIPATVHDSLMARLDRLGPARELAQLGSALGRDFSYDLLRAIAPRDEGRLQHELYALVEAEILYQHGLLPQATYQFKHALIQDAAYQSQLKSKRQQVHDQIAQALERQFPQLRDTQPELVAHHLSEAGLFEPASKYWQEAGQRASSRSAYWEALACFEHALKMTQQVPESKERRLQSIELRFDLRNVLMPLGDYERLLTYLREAESEAVSLGDQRRLAQVYSYLTNYYVAVGEPRHAAESAQRQLSAAEELGDGALQSVANFRLGMSYHTLGDYSRARDYQNKIIRYLVGDMIHERLGMGGYPAVLSRSELARILAQLGQFTDGIAIGEEGVELATKLDHPFSLTQACLGLGGVYVCKGDFQQALGSLQLGLDVAQDRGVPVFSYALAAHMGYAYMRNSAKITP